MQALQRLGMISALVSLTICAAGGAAKADTPLLIRRGVLAVGDEAFDDESLYDRHTFLGNGGQQVIISLESQDFDPYLILLDPNGRRISENDDISRNNRNSRLVITLPATGTYTAVANSYEPNKSGQYSLEVTLSDGRSSSTSTSAIIREMAGAAVPESSSRCDLAIIEAVDTLEQGRELGVLVDAAQLHQRFLSVPATRPNGISMGLDGPAARSVMFSPQFLTILSTGVMQDCTTVGAVVYSSAEAGFERTFGYLPALETVSRSPNAVPVGEFECMVPNDRPANQGDKVPWGNSMCL